MYKLELTKKVVRFIDSRTPREKIKITKTLAKLCEDPYRNDLNIKKLQGSSEVFRLRIGYYRVLYKIYDEALVILAFKAGHRKDIYKK